MKLKELQELIFDNLIIKDSSNSKIYYYVDKHGITFECLKNKTVIGIRTDGEGSLVIGVK